MRRNPFRVTWNAKASPLPSSSSFLLQQDRIAPNEPTELDTWNSDDAKTVLFNAERGRVCFAENFGVVEVVIGRVF